MECLFLRLVYVFMCSNILAQDHPKVQTQHCLSLVIFLVTHSENMNEGKSQTFLYFSSLLMEKYGIDYAMKCDADSILHLHDYFLFAHRNLPPAPYNTNIYVGALRDKAYWPKHSEEEIDRFESFFGTEFEGVHLYLYVHTYRTCHAFLLFFYLLLSFTFFESHSLIC